MVTTHNENPAAKGSKVKEETPASTIAKPAETRALAPLEEKGLAPAPALAPGVKMTKNGFMMLDDGGERLYVAAVATNCVQGYLLRGEAYPRVNADTGEIEKGESYVIETTARTLVVKKGTSLEDCRTIDEAIKAGAFWVDANVIVHLGAKVGLKKFKPLLRTKRLAEVTATFVARRKTGHVSGTRKAWNYETGWMPTNIARPAMELLKASEDVFALAARDAEWEESEADGDDD